MRLKEIWIYPIKSLRGISLSQSVLEQRGLQYDRRWMLVDEKNRFVSQREFPQLSQLFTKIKHDKLCVFTNTDPGIAFPIAGETELPPIRVQIWDDVVTAHPGPDAAHNWFSKTLQQQVRLVYMSDNSIRPADPDYAPKDSTVSFADGFPYLIAGTASLQQLSAKAGKTLDIQRFRPNLVIETIVPFEEDNWKTIQLGNSRFSIVKPCARCQVVDIDPVTGIPQKDVLPVLAQFRRKANKVLFGMNALWQPDSANIISVDDIITKRELS